MNHNESTLAQKLFPNNPSSTSLEQFLFFFIIGIFLALAIQFITQKIYGKFLKTLRDAGASNEVFSKTLEEIGYSNNKIIKRALKRKKSLVCSVVESVTDEKGAVRYYIAEEHSKKAEALYRADGFTLWVVMILAAALVAVFLICKYFIPYLLD